MIATGPWFVLTPAPRPGTARVAVEGGPNGQQHWDAEQFLNGQDANNKAIEMVRNGHPYVYIGRATHRMEMPVQMTTLIERKPTPDTQEIE